MNKLELTFEKDIDVTTLSYDEMLYYMKHNVFVYINVLFTLRLKQWEK